MAFGNVIKSYLVSLGFSVDKNQFSGFSDAIKNADKQIGAFSGSIASSMAKSSVGVVTALVAMTAATAAFVDQVAKADTETEKWARRMWFTEEGARSLNIALKAMGESWSTIEDVAANKELAGRFRELKNLADATKAPPALQEMLRDFRSITQEISKFKVMIESLKQWVTYYLLKFFGPQLAKLKQALTKFNSALQSNIARVAERIARVLEGIVNVTLSLFRAIGMVVGAVYDFLEKIPSKVKIALAAMSTAALGFFHPILLVIMAIVAALLIIDDYIGHMDGKISYFNWSAIKEKADDFTKMFKNKETGEFEIPTNPFFDSRTESGEPIEYKTPDAVKNLGVRLKNTGVILGALAEGTASIVGNINEYAMDATGMSLAEIFVVKIDEVIATLVNVAATIVDVINSILLMVLWIVSAIDKYTGGKGDQYDRALAALTGYVYEEQTINRPRGATDFGTAGGYADIIRKRQEAVDKVSGSNSGELVKATDIDLAGGYADIINRRNDRAANPLDTQTMENLLAAMQNASIANAVQKFENRYANAAGLGAGSSSNTVNDNATFNINQTFTGVPGAQQGANMMSRRLEDILAKYRTKSVIAGGR
jgi:hypothetical protein